MHNLIIEKIENERLNLGNSIDKDKVLSVFTLILSLFYPEVYKTKYEKNIDKINEIENILDEEIKKEDVTSFLNKLPTIFSLLNKDLKATYDGDPAATSYDEIITTYPGFYATIAHRIAHEFYKLKYFVVARIIAEHAHFKTGIDIHPGAKIGEYFCIDHGTGVVIGETAEVGDNVRLYQGVTLGTRSFLKDDAGQLLRNYKRHPSIGNNVIIYANASILGGDTYIGDNSTIGSNAWIDKSIPANSKIKNISGGI